MQYASDKVSYSNQSDVGSTDASQAEIVPFVKEPIPAFDKGSELSGDFIRRTLQQAVQAGLLSHTREAEFANRMIDRLSIKTAGASQGGR